MKKKFVPFHEFLRPDLAYTASDIAILLKISPITARKYLRRGVAMGLLTVKRKGRFKVYALTEKAIKLRQETGEGEPRIAWLNSGETVVSSGQTPG